MDFFWGNVFEYFKDRRLGAVFFGTLTALIGTLAAGAIFYQITDGFYPLEDWPYLMSGIGLLLLALIWRGRKRARARRLNRYQPSPLSRDELHKARSKLRTKTTFKSL